jgi:hypothetical protein
MWLGERFNGHFVPALLLFAATAGVAGFRVRLTTGVMPCSSRIGISIGVAAPILRALRMFRQRDTRHQHRGVAR